MPFSPRAAVKDVQDSSLTARAFVNACRRPCYVRDTLARWNRWERARRPFVTMTGFFTGAVAPCMEGDGCAFKAFSVSSFFW